MIVIVGIIFTLTSITAILASGCCLLLAGSVADIVGNRIISLGGCLMLAIFIAASGVARTGVQFIIFGAFQGVGTAMFFPTSISVLTSTVPRGKSRNVGFSCLGLAQPVGLQVGLILAGVFQKKGVSWRFGFYLCAGIMWVCSVLAWWCMPPGQSREKVTKKRMIYGIDWIGILISSSALGLLSYVLAELSQSTSNIHGAANISLLAITGVLAISFIFWMHHQGSRCAVALISNSLWRNGRFSTLCAMVIICWAVANIFQHVQGLSALDSALRFLPNVLFGVVVNLATGLLVHRLPTNIFVVTVSVISTVSPLLMAIVSPSWSFWICTFWAVLVVPTAQDVIFTVANLAITDAFTEDTHALAGAVFNTISMFGTAVGIAVMAAISQAVTNHSSFNDKRSPDALILAAFWASFGLMIVMTLIGATRLRKLWKIGSAHS
ncbi:MFS general substrate transporter [Zopfia rhizophila CBS 207.26]|uniref:MFS general substrate transporter n=1 Tax=Zopfia rhizophila CBS 207.26 TaxID=1314779 RepID=A0A6A6EB81_9PEZI|nr:MFS general substrate transporter [Zopfia rhizophila CBS 207.26]